jgi:hypothetical protein
VRIENALRTLNDQTVQVGLLGFLGKRCPEPMEEVENARLLELDSGARGFKERDLRTLAPVDEGEDDRQDDQQPQYDTRPHR